MVGGITKENVDVVKELLAIRKEEKAAEAKADFASAFAALQSECQPIKASKAVPGKNDIIKYWYAPYEKIMEQVSPLLRNHGFAITFDTEIADGRVTATCTLMHRSGHERSNKFACRIGSGPPNSSEAQGDGAATTYAKRFALCAALNIVVETGSDNDARPEGGFITQAEADELAKACEDSKADKAAVLAWLAAPSFEEVKQSMLKDARNYFAERLAKLAAKR
jgi:hypothetical protein